MNTLINKIFLTSASALSVLGLLLTVPQGVAAQEMEDMDMDATESVEMDSDDRIGQSYDMEEDDMDMDAADMESDDVDGDYDYDSDDADEIESESYSAPTYSNSPRALW